MTEIKIYWCKLCGKDSISTRKEVRRHLREIHGVKGMSMKTDEGSRVSASTMSEEVRR